MPSSRGEPAKVNSRSQGRGLVLQDELADPKELDGLMDEAQYKAYVEGLG